MEDQNLICSNCGTLMTHRRNSSACPICQLDEKIWFVFSPCHGTFVLGVDEEHAWRVAGEPEDMKPKRIVRPAEFRNGLLVVNIADLEMRLEPQYYGPGKKSDRIVDVLIGRPLECVKQMDDEPQPPIEPIVEGARVSSVYNAPLEDKAVLIVGAGSTRPLMREYLEREPGAEVWTLNDERCPEQTRHFQIHLRSAFPTCGEGYFYVDDLRERGVIVYEPHTFPYDGIRRVWLNSSIDYMLALADAEGFSRIYMPGIDFGGFREPKEMDSSRYWIGVLEGKGAVVYMSPLFAAFDCMIYGHNKLPKEFEY